MKKSRCGTAGAVGGAGSLFRRGGEQSFPLSNEEDQRRSWRRERSPAGALLRRGSSASGAGRGSSAPGLLWSIWRRPGLFFAGAPLVGRRWRRLHAGRRR
jgi:hypothetical protein